MSPHIDIDFMSGSLHWRLADDGSSTKPMEAGRACRLRLPDGSTAKDAEALGASCQGHLSRIRAGFSFGFKRGQVSCSLSPDGMAALSEIKGMAERPRNA